jgi:hypothetical protein
MPFASRFWPSWRRQGATDKNVAITYCQSDEQSEKSKPSPVAA